ncbi:MAG: prepilin peptidase [Clostridiales bacterium]|jgi:leader peptidase (prepilin peptidase)/N-methyltransferase|nr:prepilin peptidase [Clostridiales bacterium]
MYYIDIFFLIILAVAGLCVGSFLNVIIYRLPREQSIIKPRSFCPKCGHKIKAYENIPVFSYIFLRGKCSECKEKISVRYPIVEIITAVLWVLPLILLPSYTAIDIANIVIAALFSTVLLAIFIIDFEHLIIPNELVISIIVLSIPAFFTQNDLIVWYEKLIGFAVGGGILYLLAYLSEKFLKKEGVGGGDIKLMAACGLVLGWQNILLSLFVAAIITMIVILLVMTPIKKKLPIGEIVPFAPALSAAMVICLYYGEDIIFWYLTSIMGL